MKKKFNEEKLPYMICYQDLYVRCPKHSSLLTDPKTGKVLPATETEKCEICHKQEGLLVLCDDCDKAFYFTCLRIKPEDHPKKDEKLFCRNCRLKRALEEMKNSLAARNSKSVKIEQNIFNI